MSDKKTLIGDKMIEAQLNEKSKMLDISVDELIDRYIRRGIYRDNYYEQTPLSEEKLSNVINIDKKSKKHKKENSMDNLIDIYVDPDE